MGPLTFRPPWNRIDVGKCYSTLTETKEYTYQILLPTEALQHSRISTGMKLEAQFARDHFHPPKELTAPFLFVLNGAKLEAKVCLLKAFVQTQHSSQHDRPLKAQKRKKKSRSRGSIMEDHPQALTAKLSSVILPEMTLLESKEQLQIPLEEVASEGTSLVSEALHNVTLLSLMLRLFRKVKRFGFSHNNLVFLILIYICGIHRQSFQKQKTWKHLSEAIGQEQSYTHRTLLSQIHIDVGIWQCDSICVYIGPYLTEYRYQKSWERKENKRKLDYFIYPVALIVKPIHSSLYMCSLTLLQ